MNLQRTTDTIGPYTAPSSAGSNQGFPFGSCSAGQVKVPSTSALVGPITWYCGDTINGGTNGWYAVQDGAGNAVTSTITAGNACLIPAACFACKFLLPVVATPGVIYIDLKS